MATKKATTQKSARTTTASKKPSTKAVRSSLKRINPIRTQVGDENAKEIVLALPPVKAPKFLQGFVDFVRTQGVVGLAVGLVLGVAAKSVVDSLVANVFNPIIGLIGADGGSLDGKYICLKTIEGACTNKLGYGNVLSNVISFMIVAGVVYFIIKGLKLDKLDKPKS